MRLQVIQLDFLSVNCYLFWDEGSGRALLVDPGSSEARIEAEVARLGVKPEGVLLTHAHVDHIGRVPEICGKYGIPVWIHPGDVPLYESEDNNLLPWAAAVEGLPKPVADCPTAGLPMAVLHTPGHSPGSVCFHFPQEHILLSGDTLFQGTYGRTDFQGGDERAIFRSIRNVLLTLPPETVVYPGHGPSTTIAAERKNPLFH